MKKIVLHVGSGKTGSSSIQKALINCAARRQTGFSFPVLAQTKSNQMFRFAFCSLRETTINVRQRFSHLGGDAEFKVYQEELQNSFRKQVAENEVVIVSSEFLFLSSLEEVNRVNSYLKDCGFSEIHVVVYLRDPANYYLSAAQQALKNQYKLPNPCDFRLEMCSAIENWSSISPTSMTIREFDRSLLLDGNVVSDFEAYLLSVGIVAELDCRTASNETLSAEATQALQDYHLCALETVKTVEQRKSHISRVRQFIKSNPDGTRPKLKKDISEYIYSRFKNEVLQIYSDFGVFRKLVDYYDGASEELAVEKCEVQTFRDIVVDFDWEIYRKARDQF